MQPQTISERITHARERRGLTQGELARQSGIAATQLSRYETGRAAPRKLAVARLAQALAVNLQWLETGEGELDEYPTPDNTDKGLGFWLDDELRRRLLTYADYHGLSAVEALADILDPPLSVFSEEALPPTQEERAELRRTIAKYRSNRVRTELVAKKIRLFSPPPETRTEYAQQMEALRSYEAMIRRTSFLEERPPPVPRSYGPRRSPNARKPKP